MTPVNQTSSICYYGSFTLPLPTERERPGVNGVDILPFSTLYYLCPSRMSRLWDHDGTLIYNDLRKRESQWRCDNPDSFITVSSDIKRSWAGGCSFCVDH